MKLTNNKKMFQKILKKYQIINNKMKEKIKIIINKINKKMIKMKLLIKLIKNWK